MSAGPTAAVWAIESRVLPSGTGARLLTKLVSTAGRCASTGRCSTTSRLSPGPYADHRLDLRAVVGGGGHLVAARVEVEAADDLLGLDALPDHLAVDAEVPGGADDPLDQEHLTGPVRRGRCRTRRSDQSDHEHHQKMSSSSAHRDPPIPMNAVPPGYRSPGSMHRPGRLRHPPGGAGYRSLGLGCAESERMGSARLRRIPPGGWLTMLRRTRALAGPVHPRPGPPLDVADRRADATPPALALSRDARLRPRGRPAVAGGAADEPRLATGHAEGPPPVGPRPAREGPPTRLRDPPPPSRSRHGGAGRRGRGGRRSGVAGGLDLPDPTGSANHVAVRGGASGTRPGNSPEGPGLTRPGIHLSVRPDHLGDLHVVERIIAPTPVAVLPLSAPPALTGGAGPLPGSWTCRPAPTAPP